MGSYSFGHDITALPHCIVCIFTANTQYTLSSTCYTTHAHPDCTGPSPAILTQLIYSCPRIVCSHEVTSTLGFSNTERSVRAKSTYDNEPRTDFRSSAYRDPTYMTPRSQSCRSRRSNVFLNAHSCPSTFVTVLFPRSSPHVRVAYSRPFYFCDTMRWHGGWAHGFTARMTWCEWVFEIAGSGGFGYRGGGGMRVAGCRMVFGAERRARGARVMGCLWMCGDVHCDMDRDELLGYGVGYVPKYGLN